MKLVDSDNNIIYEGTDAFKLRNLLLGPATDVSETDEVMFGEILHKTWTGTLFVELDTKFEGIDYWSRPVFKLSELNTFIGSITVLVPDKHLFPTNSKEEIINYFKNNPDKLVIFCNDIENDPMGTSIGKHIKLNFII